MIANRMCKPSTVEESCNLERVYTTIIGNGNDNYLSFRIDLCEIPMCPKESYLRRARSCSSQLTLFPVRLAQSAAVQNHHRAAGEKTPGSPIARHDLALLQWRIE